ncbi:hypothetical protein GCM10010404_79520 [Nonomuraea africana]
MNGGTGGTVTVPASRLTAVTDSTVVPSGAFTEMDEHVNETAAERVVPAEAAAGRHAAAASDTPAAKMIRRRFMTFLSLMCRVVGCCGASHCRSRPGPGTSVS